MENQELVIKSLETLVEHYKKQAEYWQGKFKNICKENNYIIDNDEFKVERTKAYIEEPENSESAKCLRELQKQQIIEVVGKTSTIRQAANILKVSERTIYRKIKEFDIDLLALRNEQNPVNPIPETIEESCKLKHISYYSKNVLCNRLDFERWDELNGLSQNTLTKAYGVGSSTLMIIKSELKKRGFELTI